MQNQRKLMKQTAAAAKRRKPEYKAEHKPSTDKKLDWDWRVPTAQYSRDRVQFR